MPGISSRSTAFALLISLGAGALAVALILVFYDGSTPAERPIGGPEPTPSRETSLHDSGCPVLDEESEDLPVTYSRVGKGGGGDVIGDGRPSLAQVFADENQPLRCRYYLLLAHPGGRTLSAPIKALSWLPAPPAILFSVELDGEPGLEIVLDFGGPGHPHRTGQIFTFRGGSLQTGSLARMHIQAPPDYLSFLFPLNDEFAGGVDCAGEPGTIVITEGGFAEQGNDDHHYDIIRTFYRAIGSTFVEVRTDSYIVDVGTERERWPELADDPFRSCP